ncbi:2-oxo-4-hydroxy-4-carboxy-5-ureidoimidazoline decarboxylase [Aeribacillus sp. FSL M8-0254]|uniref:2-oxo-4-hydroxy-4-carboxy-5-ureidoimidazoline decarboxylase n=1 Tax=Aeribacillus sp. FSL M8-0254 TaxID=2954577 RepID=UPI0030F66567
MDIEQVNQLSAAEFIEKLGGIFEDSTWVAEKAEKFRPFSSVQSLFSKIAEIVDQADEHEKLALIRNHPALGARTKMTRFSQTEQQKAGLQKLTDEEFDRLLKLNETYMEKFQFPFILAVRGKTKQEIFASIEQRIKNNAEAEIEQAIAEIKKIAYFRLKDIVKEERNLC